MINKCENNSLSQITLTPNSRLARHLSHEFARSSKLLAWQSWLKIMHTEALFHAKVPLRLLTPGQELLLWQEIISQSNAGQQLLQIDTTAKTAQQAYAMLRAWNVSPNYLVRESENPDTETFYQWCCQFQQRCQQQQVLAQSDLIDWLIETLPTAVLPMQLRLVNFDDIPPQNSKFLQHLEKAGCEITQQDISQPLESSATISCHDLEDELYTMARWAKALHGQNPSFKIMCVIPNLSQIRTQILDCFQTVFTPERLFNPDVHQEIYNISGGYPLSNAPIIHIALQILSLNAYSTDYQTLSSLLLSPFINGYQSEMFNRALFDAKLRELDEPRLSWRLVLNTLKKEAAEYAPALSKQLAQWLEQRRTLKQKKSLSQWQTLFYELLQQIGWPGERTLNSTEHQQVKRFYGLLHTLPTITLTEQTYTYSAALQLLQQYCHDTLFETESHDGPIQILGLLEAAGLNADYSWLMHLDDETWPAAAAPNPLLPYHLQRDHQMPHSSAERELAFSQQLQHRFENSSRHIIYSYHRHDGDRELNISPLINHIPTITNSDLPLANFIPLSKTISLGPQTEIIDDQSAPLVSTSEKTPGGTGIFKQQAACPFRAFATYRLHAEGLVEPETGLNALERGSVLHSCLDHIWAELKTQHKLLTIDEIKLDHIISAAIEAAFEACFPKYTSKLGKRFKQLETERLHELLYNWLQHEKQRPAFKVIAHEQWRRAEFNRLKLNLQIDRIDELENGQRLVIDYKSGITSPKHWLGHRPREPQLPLYCLIEKNIDAISFAQVRSDDMRFKGIAANDIHIDGIKSIDEIKDEQVPETWNELLRKWDWTLEMLADSFFAGMASVDPANYDTCDYCELHSLCRIGEKA